MIILNTSFHLLSAHESEFIEWAKKTYLPAAEACQLFSDLIFSRITTEIDPQVCAFAIQLHADSLEKVTRWHDDEASLLKAELTKRWGENVVYFTTYMETVD